MYSIFAKGAPKAQGTYSQGASAARYVYVSAQQPVVPETGELLDGSLEEQVIQALANIEQILSEVDLDVDAICHMQLWLTNLDDLPTIDSVLARYLSKPYPARDVCEVQRLPFDAPLQISCIACR